MKEVILITGATGFLGCHLSELLTEHNYKIIATKRAKSNLKNCIEFQDKITWINIDEDEWKDKLIGWQPKIIIHAAWIGVSATERSDWELQSKNLLFLQDLLFIARKSKTKKLIAFGSQAEYGSIDNIVTEFYPLNPTSAYGVFKILSSQLLKYHCEIHKIEWYWFRLFSVFGEKEGAEWLIPNVIQTILARDKKSMAFSPGEQQYAYLYVRDFVNAIMKAIVNKENKRGCYNLSAVQPLPLKLIITLIRDKIDPAFKLEFGALPYRHNQSMLIAGDMTLFNESFGSIEITPFEESINNTINFYASKLLNESI
ncbi:MAG: NAD-dependent epimerase/dehydratase family protein [Bacteroidota bacterium]|nr:NAD-dependent epimerase/dehydratase family protein [Bacteroidota bacterium]